MERGCGAVGALQTSFPMVPGLLLCSIWGTRGPRVVSRKAGQRGAPSPMSMQDLAPGPSLGRGTL